MQIKMTLKKFIKLVAFNFGLILLNVIVFSKAFFGIVMSLENAFQAAIGAAILFISASSFIIINWKLINPVKIQNIIPFELPEKGIQTFEHCSNAIRHYIAVNINTFKQDLETIDKQIVRYEKKRDTLSKVLLDRFNEGEISFEKFMSAIKSTEHIMIINIKNVLSKLDAFDEEEFVEMENSRNSQYLRDSTVQARREIFEEYIRFVKKAVSDNEDIMLKLDKLLLEITRLSEIAIQDIENMEAMQAIDQLINDTKWYK